MSFVDAFYFTIVTMSTVGYGDIYPVTAAGKIFCIFLIIVGIGTFLTLLTGFAQWMIQQQQYALHRHRMNMLIGVFFTEVGNQLLHIFTRFDPNIGNVCKDFRVKEEWSEAEFLQFCKRLNEYEYIVDPGRLEIESLHLFLKENVDMILRQLENIDINENETFAELLWSLVHIKEELSARSAALNNHPEPDVAHLASDVERAYSLLTSEWTGYLKYLKTRYPFQFSLALRSNPFVENPSAVILES